VTLSLRATIAERTFDVALEVAAGETVAILGPNGAGKSTLLAVLAGLLRPDSGSASLAGASLFDLDGSGAAGSAGSAWVPPHRRGIALLEQRPLLFPHLSVRANVEFGPRSRGAGRSVARQRATQWLGEVGATELELRKPLELSGGQAQRVAVARALAADPTLLLLDEAFAALDATVAPAIRRMLGRVLVDRTVLIVTHDVLDALTLADRVIVMDRGTIVEQGPTREVLDTPRTRFTAALAGLNLVTGTRTAAGLRTAEGAELVAGVTKGAASAHPTDGVGRPAAVCVRPSAVRVSTVPPDGGNAIAETVLDIEPRGDLLRVRSATVSADLSPADVVDLDLAPGSSIWFTFDPAAARVYAL